MKLPPPPPPIPPCTIKMSSIFNLKTEGEVLWYNGGVGQGLSETLQGSHAGQLLR